MPSMDESATEHINDPFDPSVKFGRDRENWIRNDENAHGFAVGFA